MGASLELSGLHSRHLLEVGCNDERLVFIGKVRHRADIAART